MKSRTDSKPKLRQVRNRRHGDTGLLGQLLDRGDDRRLRVGQYGTRDHGLCRGQLLQALLHLLQQIV